MITVNIIIDGHSFCMLEISGLIALFTQVMM